MPDALRAADFRPVGRGLHRPEGVAVGPDGTVWASDAASAAARVEPGPTAPVGSAGGEPNSLNFLPSGELLIANFQGHLQLLDTSTGEVRSFVEEVDGRRIIHANYALADANGFVWASESTRFEQPDPETIPKMLENPDGWVFVRRPDGSSEIVADGLVFANGLCFSPDGRWLYMAETLSGVIRRARIKPGGAFGDSEQWFAFERDGREAEAMGVPGPDGMGFDESGRLWVGVWNRGALAVVAPDGTLEAMITDPDGTALDWPTNVAWGGPDRRTLYVASIVLPHLSAASVTAPGIPQPWEIVTPAAG